MLKLALKQQRELRLAITIDVSVLLAGRGAGGGGSRLFIHWHLFIPNFPLLVHEGFGPSFVWMGNLATLEAKFQGVGYDGDGDMVVGAVTVPEVIVHLVVADMHIDYDAALLIVQSSEACRYGDLVSRTKLLLRTPNNYVLLHIASGR